MSVMNDSPDHIEPAEIKLDQPESGQTSLNQARPVWIRLKGVVGQGAVQCL